MRSSYLRRFIPYQLWRFAVLNFRMYAIARGWIGARPAPPPAGTPAAPPRIPVTPGSVR